MQDIFNRVELLLGEDALKRLAGARVIVFGVGGVGSWTAEALVRTGIGHLTIVDADNVAESNINRQLMALTTTVGLPKVDLLRERLLQINPQAEIVALNRRYEPATSDEFRIQDYDLAVDAIDSLTDKADLLLTATRLKVRIVSSMGAALKVDPTRVRIDDFSKVRGCRLAAALRNKFKRMGRYPSRKFKCVYSDEIVENRGSRPDESGAKSYGKVATNGALCHVTAIFGMMLAGLVVRSITEG